MTPMKATPFVSLPLLPLLTSIKLSSIHCINHKLTPLFDALWPPITSVGWHTVKSGWYLFFDAEIHELTQRNPAGFCHPSSGWEAAIERQMMTKNFSLSFKLSLDVFSWKEFLIREESSCGSFEDIKLSHCLEPPWKAGSIQGGDNLNYSWTFRRNSLFSFCGQRFEKVSHIHFFVVVLFQNDETSSLQKFGPQTWALNVAERWPSVTTNFKTMLICWCTLMWLHKGKGQFSWFERDQGLHYCCLIRFMCF